MSKQSSVKLRLRILAGALALLSTVPPPLGAEILADVRICDVRMSFERIGPPRELDVDGDGHSETVEVIRSREDASTYARYRAGADDAWQYFSPSRLIFRRDLREFPSCGALLERMRDMFGALGLIVSELEALADDLCVVRATRAPGEPPGILFDAQPLDDVALAENLADRLSSPAHPAPALAILERIRGATSGVYELSFLPGAPSPLLDVSPSPALAGMNVQPDTLVHREPLEVERETPAETARPCPPDAVRSWGLDEIGAPDVWQSFLRAPQGEGIRVAVLDSRTCPHACLDGRIPWEVAMDNPSDCQATASGHGTFVAGIVGAENKLDGVAPGAELVPIRALGDDDCGWSSDILRGIHHAIDKSVRVIAAAWVMKRDVPYLEDAIRHAGEHGIVFVTPNELFPAQWKEQLPGLIAVGGLESSAGDRVWDEGAHVVAPSTVEQALGIQNNYVYPAGGTSAAVAYTAGAAALYLANCPDALPEEVRKRLIGTARGGVLNISDALDLGNDPPSPCDD